MNFTLFIQPNAQNHLNSLIAKNDGKNAIKLGFKIAGCNGYQYVLNLVNKDENPININNTYKTYEFSGLSFIIENDDLPRLNNVIIDYKREGLNSFLTYDNPNVSYECGCGESVTFN